MQEIGVIGPVEFVGFAHNVARCRRASLTSFEHLHWRADQVTNRINIGYTRAHVLVNENLALLSDRYAEHLPVVFGFSPLTCADECEVTCYRLLGAVLHITNDNFFYITVAIAFNCNRFNSLKNLHPALPHAINYVLTQVFVDVVKARSTHEGFARYNG